MTISTPAPEYPIIYILDGGVNDKANPETYREGVGVAEFKPAVKTYYDFVGWYDQKPDLPEAKKVEFLPPTQHGRVELFAKYTPKSYHLMYEANGGINPTDNPVSYTYGVGTGELKEATKEDCEFEGWFYKKATPTVTGSSAEIDPAAGWEKLTSVTRDMAGDIALSAKYKTNVYHITYDCDGGTNSEKNPDTYRAGEGLEKLYDATKKGYVFAGWFLEEDYLTEMTGIPADMEEDITLHACFMKNSEDDPKGATFGPLFARVIKTTKTSIKYEWSKIKDADGYLIYGNLCNKKDEVYRYKLVADTKKTNWTASGLKKNRYYKYYIAAYKIENGKKAVLCKSKTIHETTKNKKHGSATSIKVNSSNVTIKKGDTFTIRAKEISNGKIIPSHRPICYESADPQIAKVNKNGVVKAKKKGKTEVYVFAQNGLYVVVKIHVE